MSVQVKVEITVMAMSGDLMAGSSHTEVVIGDDPEKVMLETIVLAKELGNETHQSIVEQIEQMRQIAAEEEEPPRPSRAQRRRR